jgi:arylsulfatase
MRSLALLFLGCISISAACAKPMNIVLLYADDWRFDTLGVAGNPVLKTPVLDALSAKGVRFTENRVTTAICGVSRATLLTGQWMSRHGNEAFSMFRTPWEQTFPGVLRENGYHLGYVGKWHCGKFPAKRFDLARAYSGKHWMKDEEGNDIHVTAKNEKDSLEFLRERPEDKPFCLTVAFFATHAEDANPEQFLPQKESMALYEDQMIPVPPNMTDDSFRRLPPFIANEKNEGRARWHWRFDEPEKYQRMMKNYYRMATEVDATCGRILEELERQGVRGETLVIFTTDNGFFHGEHGLADKWYPHQESIRVPLIVDDPRMRAEVRGVANEALTLNVDLAPTILSAAEVEIPEGMQGRDISPLYLSADPVMWRSEYFYEHATIRNTDFIPSSQALVRKDWKYIYWPDFGKEQLFDLTNDPREEHDLAEESAQAGRLAEMRERFRELREAAK